MAYIAAQTITPTWLDMVQTALSARPEVVETWQAMDDCGRPVVAAVVEDCVTEVRHSGIALYPSRTAWLRGYAVWDREWTIPEILEGVSGSPTRAASAAIREARALAEGTLTDPRDITGRVEARTEVTGDPSPCSTDRPTARQPYLPRLARPPASRVPSLTGAPIMSALTARSLTTDEVRSGDSVLQIARDWYGPAVRDVVATGPYAPAGSGDAPVQQFDAHGTHGQIIDTLEVGWPADDLHRATTTCIDAQDLSAAARTALDDAIRRATAAGMPEAQIAAMTGSTRKAVRRVLGMR